MVAGGDFPLLRRARRAPAFLLLAGLAVGWAGSEAAAQSPAGPAEAKAGETSDGAGPQAAKPEARKPDAAKTVAAATPADDAANAKAAPKGAAGGESVDHAICRLIDGAAKAEGLPTSFFTRLIWRESSFRVDVVSHAGAQGIAQFMPGTAKERGLANPFDPESAIPASARLLVDLRNQFGNLGLAAAAYNAGPGRVNGFLTGGGLPNETRNYVKIITGRTAEDWAEIKRQGVEQPSFPDEPCLKTVASLRKGAPPPAGTIAEIFAPWGVQISGNYSKSVALASFQREAGKYRTVFGDVRPMVVATKVGGLGSKVYYRVRLPAQTRVAANQICDKLRKAGGACLVLPN